jgi:hypothetical protein
MKMSEKVESHYDNPVIAPDESVPRFRTGSKHIRLTLVIIYLGWTIKNDSLFTGAMIVLIDRQTLVDWMGIKKVP